MKIRPLQRGCAWLLCVLLLVGSLAGCNTGEVEEEEISTDPAYLYETVFDGGAEYEACAPEAGSALLYDLTSRQQLYGKNVHLQTAPASLTKLLTAIVAARLVPLDTVVTVGSELALTAENSSICQIAAGQQLTLRNLLEGMLLVSGNDAAQVVAVNTARISSGNMALSDLEAREAFCALMNTAAADLGATESHFLTPDGWDTQGQYTTAADVLRFAVYALSIPEIAEIVAKTDDYITFDSGEHITWTNTNVLLQPGGAYYYADCVGIKTGTTDAAGRCLVAAARRNGRTLIAVVMNCPSDDARYRSAIQLFEQGFAAEITGEEGVVG